MWALFSVKLLWVIGRCYSSCWLFPSYITPSPTDGLPILLVRVWRWAFLYMCLEVIETLQPLYDVLCGCTNVIGDGDELQGISVRESMRKESRR